ncbi:hypothetical protein GCM10009119_30800 [Algoriphagus jejuensis]|uniref:Uncharacterized protein n=1 Tax=Algoriphagus jejuensis TaxID=419934 RepID=A0ABN1N342_9BACT
MPGFTESSITLNFPDTNFFRFATCAGYSALSGNHFKEMDACWFDTDNNLYWLIELKDFSLASLTTQETIEKKSWDIVKKAIDSLCMFLSSKHGYPYADGLNPCFPASTPNNTTQFKFVTIIHCNASQKADVQLINERFRNKFKPYAELFEISNYAVVEHSRAISILPNNMIQ